MYGCFVTIHYPTLKIYSMKKINQIIFGSALVASIVLSTSCKKEAEPGPAGADGKSANALLYKQEGTTLKLSGIYSSDAAAFENTYNLSYYASLDENAVSQETIELQEGDNEARASATETRYTYHIVRRDLNNSVLSFDVVFYEGDDEPFVNNLNIDIFDNITSTGYKRISTGNFSYPSISSNDPLINYFERASLYYDQLENPDNLLVLSEWDYNPTTRNISFKYSGTLVNRYNSTKNDLTIDARVSANLNNETYRKGRE